MDKEILSIAGFDVTATEVINRVVPNRHPLIKGQPYRLAIIGEAPGEQEASRGEPFVGPSGWHLNNALSRAGLIRDACFIGNIVQSQPPHNRIELFSRSGPEFAHGLERLATDLTTFNPHLCLLLGKTALWAAKGVDDISNWRGSAFYGTKAPFLGRKCLATYHPAACMRQYEWMPLLLLDVIKASKLAKSPILFLPERRLDVELSAVEIAAKLDEINVALTPIAIDIEGYVDDMTCISIATSPSYAFIVPFSGWSLDDEMLLWRSLGRVLGNPKVPKILQNSLYDRFVLQYSYKCVVRGVVDDTMLRQHELYCELEKSLGFLCSIFTDEPYYKFERKVDDKLTHYRYCCKDSCVTHEINTKMTPFITGSSDTHYRFNMDLLNPILYMENRGIRYNSDLALTRLFEVDDMLAGLQYQLDQAAGVGFNFLALTKSQLLAEVQSQICYKRDPNLPKAGNAEAYSKAKAILTSPADLTPAQRGWLNIVCGRSMNIKSPGFKDFLYTKLGCPKQYKDTKSTSGETKKVLTSDYEALLKIYKATSHQAVDLAIQIGLLRTRSQMLHISADLDGRVRCGYNVVGTETGRLTCYTSPTGSGYNLQTIPAEDSLRPAGHPLRNGMRDLFCADDGYYLFQCDLSGADGWTVAAHLAALGDVTMLDDYRAGIKPAKVLCYLLRNGATSLDGKSRDDIKRLTKSIGKEDWDYFASKQGQHGTCYLMGPRTLVNRIFISSEGKVKITEATATELQRLFKIRYRVTLWHDWMSRHLAKQTYPPSLRSASGHVRKFFGRTKEILGEALAHEPQNNTTYATNLAALRLWNDPENRDGNRLIIQPLHQVHDALVGQFPIDRVEWAKAKIREYFNNTIFIANQPIVIPFEGNYGLNWALDEQSKKGDI